MASKEQRHPFYKPLWRRVAIVATIVFWACFEFYNGERGIWLMIAVAFLGYAIYTFFLTWPKDDGAPPA